MKKLKSAITAALSHCHNYKESMLLERDNGYELKIWNTHHKGEWTFIGYFNNTDKYFNFYINGDIVTVKHTERRYYGYEDIVIERSCKINELTNLMAQW